MKIFATSDLHIGRENSDQLKMFKSKIEKEEPDVAIISGDVYDYRGINPFQEFHNIGIPVIFCFPSIFDSHIACTVLIIVFCRTPFQIFGLVIRFDFVFMVDERKTGRIRNKGQCNQTMNKEFFTLLFFE